MTVQKFTEIAAELKRRIASGAAEAQLPSEKTVAAEFGVARMTAARALNLLCEWNLARRIPGRGTFAVTRGKRTVGVCGGDPEFFELLRRAAAEHFPCLALERRDSGDAELLVVITSPPFAYEQLLRPLPPHRVRRAREAGRLFPFAFDIHRRDGFTYGLPAFFSPLVLAWNRKIMRDIAPDFNPFALSAGQFRNLCAAAQTHGLSGFAADYARMFLQQALLSVSDAPPGAEEVARALDAVLPLFDYCGGLEDFVAGRALFSGTTRTRLAWLGRENVDFDLAPPPEFFGTPCLTVISESLCVNRHAEEPEALFDLCDFTVSETFQTMLAREFSGVPVDRTAALSALKCRPFRDDLFFSGTDRIRLLNRRFEVPVVRELGPLYNDIITRTISAGQFKKRLLEVFRAADLERRRQRQVFDKLSTFIQGE